MQVIWFRTHGLSRCFSIEVDTEFASHVWDKLEKEFLMVSTRPTPHDLTSPSLDDDPYWKELFEVTK